MWANFSDFRQKSAEFVGNNLLLDSRILILNKSEHVEPDIFDICKLSLITYQGGNRKR